MPDFDTIRIKYIADVFTGNSIPDDQKDNYVNKDIPYIPTKEIDADTGVINYENGLSVAETDAFKIAPPNATIMCIEGGSAGKKIGFTDRRIAFVNKLCCFISKKGYARYLFYSLQSQDFLEQFNLSMTGLIGGVSVSDLKNLEIAYPDGIRLQQAIADYLDIKNIQIDALIANEQAQIEKLKQYKQSLITEVITKGLEPNVPMKDSGVEWIGEIPKHWTIMRGKYLFFETDRRSIDGSEELLTVSQYSGITPRSQKNVNMFEALSLVDYKICEVGDIAANTMWMWAGAIGVSNYHGVISPSYNVYRPYSNFFNPVFLDNLLRTPTLVQEYESLSTGIRASRLRLYPKDFLNILFPVPPIEEQDRIVEELQSKLKKADQLISLKQSKIDKLSQYKKSLIYEYVTGKKEVCCHDN